jgi:hypothetical protein
MSEQRAKEFQPGPDLLTAVRAGFIYQGTNFSAWCRRNGVNRRNAAMALLGGWRGPKGKTLARRIANAAGAGEVRWQK